MRKLAIHHLRNEKYLGNDLSIENLVDNEIMPLFENEYKRSFSLSDKKRIFPFRVRYLKESPVDPKLRGNAFVLD